MLVDASKFPLVWMNNVPAPGASDEGTAFAVLEELLRRGEPFVLLTEAGDGSPDHEHTQEGKKRVSLWMKKHRQELKLMKAMVAIEPSTAKRLAMKPLSITFGKFWGYPMLMASTRGEALKMAEELLGERASESVSAAG